ncbi:hypothetical protein GNP75_15050 [Aliivibrio fischeri]|nr:hypothetical protein [Aliivibrio fischeri]MUK35129.1 hypothetical protein [Aliivibrio fischeri]
MNIQLLLVHLRKKIRANKKKVTDAIITNHSAEICIVCGSREHIPQWVYNRSTKRTFETTTNGI